MRGKNTCKILKEIRQRIAEENDIELITSECTYQGDCLGTCPKCEAELRYLEQELEKRQTLGKAAVVAGLSVGTLFAVTSCKEPQQIVEPRPMAGDVVVEVPVDTAKTINAPDTVPAKPFIEEPPLMGIPAPRDMEKEEKGEE